MSGTGTIALSLGLCLGAGQLAATPAAAAPTTVVNAAAAVAVAPKLNSSVSTSKLTYGNKVRVTVALRDPQTGKAVTKGIVYLQALRKSKWLTWTIKRVPSSGNLVFDAKPFISGYFRAYYVGAAGYKSVAGKPMKVAIVNRGAKVIAEAKKHVGALYLYGAAGPKRFDCSGYTMYVDRKAVGRKLPHKANSQKNYGKAVSKSAKKPGDLIISMSGSYGYHAAIYAGGGYIYDSPHSGARVSKRKMFSKSYVVRRLV
jgi:peptidoglycan DL-endopeptidase CwlO